MITLGASCGKFVPFFGATNSATYVAYSLNLKIIVESISLNFPLTNVFSKIY